MIPGDSNGVPFKDFCFQEWKDRYGSNPPWIKKDYIILAAALKAYGGEDEARAAWREYLRSKDPFYAGHEPRKFLSSLPRWSVKVAPKAPTLEEADERIEALRRLHREIEGDSPEKRIEIARRFKEMFP